ncbi:MAG TPA: nuclear transport factor 2 family protein [Solirubrobacteraceae bacterium]|jgi:ketosteroid isomerase-like protein|nr:nuclear transport factor 2 family protein [Solirubrobacteraceae bacterium]
MSARNVTVVQEALRHLNETGEPARHLYSPDLTFTTRGELGGGRTYSGHEGLEQGLALFRQVWDRGVTLELREVVDEGDVVVVVVRAHVAATGASGPLEAEESWATWVRDGLITRVEQYGTRDEAMRAAGLEA